MLGTHDFHGSCGFNQEKLSVIVLSLYKLNLDAAAVLLGNPYEIQYIPDN